MDDDTLRRHAERVILLKARMAEVQEQIDDETEWLRLNMRPGQGLDIGGTTVQLRRGRAKVDTKRLLADYPPDSNAGLYQRKPLPPRELVDRLRGMGVDPGTYVGRGSDYVAVMDSREDDDAL